MDLTGRTAVITGASSGVGRATALAMADHGATVVNADLHRAPRAGGLPTDELIRDEGGEATYVACDVTDLADVQRAVAAADELGGLDAFVNNVGVAESYAATETSAENWQRALDVNLTGVYHGCLAAVGAMLDGDGGAIVNVASIFGVVGGPNSLSYSTAKAGVVGLTRQIAADYARDGIRVNAVSPGFVETPMLREDTHDGTREFALAKTPMKRIGSPEEVADTITFLASDAASFVTGHNLLVDGGYSAV
jgi:NAD(P)-dependent dehydrogenase (short-subunit alcohol dehydrogenase family)